MNKIDNSNSHKMNMKLCKTLFNKTQTWDVAIVRQELTEPLSKKFTNEVVHENSFGGKDINKIFKSPASYITGSECFN